MVFENSITTAVRRSKAFKLTGSFFPRLDLNP